MNTKQQFDQQKKAVEEYAKASGYVIKKSGKFFAVYKDGQKDIGFNRYPSIFIAQIAIVCYDRVMTRQECNFVYNMPVTEKPTDAQYVSEQKVKNGEVVGLYYGLE